MEKKNVRALVFITLVLLLAALACDLSGATVTEIVDELATIVAGTLTAQSGGGGAPPSETPTNLPAPTSTPTPEPSVLRVVYINGGDVWLWTEGVGDSQLTTGHNATDVRISDDGQVAVFTEQLPGYIFNGIWAVNTDGTNIRQLVTPADLNVMSTDPNAIGVEPYGRPWDFIPGTHTVAFNTSLTYNGPGLQIQDDLRLVDADTLTLTTLLNPGDGGIFAYSPDGSQIALVTPTSISLINADGSNRRHNVLTFGSILTYSEYQYYPPPVWAMDSSFLRVAVPSVDPLAPGATTAIWRLPLDGSPAVLTATLVTTPFFGNEVMFSPDLTKLIYFQDDPAVMNSRHMHVANVDGSGDVLYHTGEIWLEGWAPDSARFVFALGDPLNLQLGQVGGGFIPLTDTPTAMNVAWIDNTRFLFASGGYGSWDVRLSPVGGPSFMVSPIMADIPQFDFDD